jgi:hypothetical protein
MSEPSKKEDGSDPSAAISPQAASSANKGKLETSIVEQPSEKQLEKEKKAQDSSEAGRKPKDSKKKSRMQRWKEAKAEKTAKAEEEAKKDGEEEGRKDNIFKNFFVCKFLY